MLENNAHGESMQMLNVTLSVSGGIIYVVSMSYCWERIVFFLFVVLFAW